MDFIVELAAFATFFLFAMTALIFTSTGRMVGSQVTNRMRLTFALVYLIILNVILFRETLTPLQIIIIVLALAGIAWVVMSHEEPPSTPHGHTGRGVLFGVLAGLGQAVILIWLWAAFAGQAGAMFTALREKPQVIRLLALGALVGPVLGVSSSLLAVQRRNWRGKHSDGMYKKPYIFLLIFPHNLAFIKCTLAKLD